MRFVSLSAVLLGACAAGPPVCPVANASRCDGQAAQICTPARDAWYTYRDCAALRPVDGARPVCCVSAATGGSTCLLPALCAPGGAP